MANINTYAVQSLNSNDKLLASDGNTGATKNVSPVDVFENNAGLSVYRASLSQLGTAAPTAVVLGSNTVGSIVWTRIGVGVYRATLANAFIGYTTVIAPAMGATNAIGFSYTSNYVTINTTASGVASDSILENTYLEIRVYQV